MTSPAWGVPARQGLAPYSLAQLPESPRVWPPNTRGDCSLPSHAHLPARPAWHRQEQDHCCWDTGWGRNAGQALTCLLNKRWSNPFLGCGEGCPFQSRSGGTVPSVLKTFSSLKHSVSIIWKREKKAAATATWSPSSRAQQSMRAVGTAWGHCPRPWWAQAGAKTYLVLPRNGHTPRGKLLVEVIVCGLQLHSFHRGELLDVQNVLAVDGLGLRSTKIVLMPGSTLMPPPPAVAHGQAQATSPCSLELAGFLFCQVQGRGWAPSALPI